MCECVHVCEREGVHVSMCMCSRCVRARIKQGGMCVYVIVYLGLHEGKNTIFQLSRQL